MIKYIGKSTIELRVSTEEEADQLHKEMNSEADKLGAVLTSWNETKREKKLKGEIIDQWVVVKYTLTFDDLKEPTTILNSINYNLSGGDYDAPFDGGSVVSAF